MVEEAQWRRQAQVIGEVGRANVVLAVNADPDDLDVDALLLPAGVGGLGRFAATYLSKRGIRPDADEVGSVTPDKPRIIELNQHHKPVIGVLVAARDGRLSSSRGTVRSVRTAVGRAILAAERRGAQSVALPLLGSGLGGMSVHKSAEGVLAGLRDLVPNIDLDRIVILVDGVKARDTVLDVWGVRQRQLSGGFDADLVRWDEAKPLVDDLGREVYTDMIAALIADRRTEMPLSVGLFGDWGSGKTHFMGMLAQRMLALAASAGEGSPYVERIVPIRFNAWTYADADLWASLAVAVFEQLAASQEPETPTDARRAARVDLAAQLVTLKDEHDRLSAELMEATTASQCAAAELARAEDERENTRSQLSEAARAARDAAKAQRAAVLTQGAAAIRSLGGTATEDVKSIRKAREDASAALSGIWGLVGELRSRSRAWPAIVGLVVLVLTGAIVAIVWPAVTAVVGRATLAGLVATVATVAVAVGKVATQATSIARKAREVLADFDRASDRLGDEALRPFREQAARAEAEVARLGEARTQLEERVARVSTELEELTDARRLYRFISDRDGAADYRSRLGVVSSVRKDFEALAEFLRHPTVGRPVDRIVLFIDDLDRCRAERVVEVLEAVHLLLAIDLFAVVVGVDPAWLDKALRAERETSSPQDYMEKIFQIPFTLPPVTAEGHGALLRRLAADPVSDDVDEATSRANVARNHGPDEAPAVEAGSELDQARYGKVSVETIGFSAVEVTFLTSLLSVIRTPRTAKRMTNVYRLIRSTRDLTMEAGLWLGTDDVPGHCQAVAQLLIVQTEAPDTYRTLTELLDRDWPEGWLQLLGSIEGCPVVTRLRGVVAGTVPDLAVYREWAPHVARFAYGVAVMRPRCTDPDVVAT